MPAETGPPLTPEFKPGELVLGNIFHDGTAGKWRPVVLVHETRRGVGGHGPHHVGAVQRRQPAAAGAWLAGLWAHRTRLALVATRLADPCPARI